MSNQSINQILEERGSRYGSFSGHAALTQTLKRNFNIYSRSYSQLTPSMVEAVDMIFHKLGRIGNGDPFYLDSWIDIVGYAQLVVDELRKQEQKQERQIAERQAVSESASNKM